MHRHLDDDNDHVRDGRGCCCVCEDQYYRVSSIRDIFTIYSKLPHEPSSGELVRESYFVWALSNYVTDKILSPGMIADKGTFVAIASFKANYLRNSMRKLPSLHWRIRCFPILPTSFFMRDIVFYLIVMDWQSRKMESDITSPLSS